METNTLIHLIDKYNILLLLQFLFVLSLIYCAARLPSLDLTPKNVSLKRKGNFKKFVWLFSSALTITLTTLLLLYFNELEAQKRSIKLSLIENSLVEFPNILEDMDRDLYIPFRCQFPEDKVRAKFFRFSKGKRENINRKIDAHKDIAYAARISLTGDGEFIWIDGGSVDVNIPVSGSCIKDGKIKILIALFNGSSEKYAIPFEFEALAPVPEARNSWVVSSRITHSEVRTGNDTKLFVRAMNRGHEGAFTFVLNILDPETQYPVSQESYEIASPSEDTFTIQHGSSYQKEWLISFKEAGTYLLNTRVKKRIGYFDLPINRKNWGDSTNYQNLFVAATDGVTAKKPVNAGNTGAIGGMNIPTVDRIAGYDAKQPEVAQDVIADFYETETRRKGATLYEGPSAKSNVMATRIRKGASVIVFGKGGDVSELIANADRYVKTEVVKLNKTGYMKKQFLSPTDAPQD